MALRRRNQTANFVCYLLSVWQRQGQYETKVIYLIEELIMAGTECIEASLDIDIINQHAAVCAPVERYAKALEPLLPGRVPYLHQSNTQRFLLSVVQRAGTQIRTRGGSPAR